MYKVLRLTIREYLAAVKTKGFIIGLLLAPVLMSGGLIASILLKDHVDIREQKIAIIDESAQMGDFLVMAADQRNESGLLDPESGEQIKPAYTLYTVTLSDDLTTLMNDLSDQVRAGDLHAFIHVESSVVQPSLDPENSHINYHAESASLDDVRDWIRGVANDQLRRLRLANAGISEEQVPDLFNWDWITAKGLLSMDESGQIMDAETSNEMQAILAPIGMVFLMFMMAMMGAMPQLSSVMEEKTQRIAEVLLGSITPFQFMLGKILGGLAVALTSTIVYVGGGIIFMNLRGLESYIPYDVLPWFIVNSILLIFMLGAILTSLGSVANDAKDAQSLSFPAMMPMMVPMFVLFPVLKEPLSSFATWLSLIPPFTPMVMILRLSTPVSIPAWQPWAGLFGVIIFTLFVVWGGSRIFRSAILMQGVPLKFSNIIRWMTKG